MNAFGSDAVLKRRPAGDIELKWSSSDAFDNVLDPNMWTKELVSELVVDCFFLEFARTYSMKESSIAYD